MLQIREVEKKVPFEYQIRGEDDPVFNLSSSLLRAYMGWMYVRASTGSGLYGYWVGTGLTDEAIVEEMMKLGKGQLESVARLHRHDGYIGRMWKVLKGEKWDSQIAADLDAMLGALLGRLRVQVHPMINPAGSAFRANTATQVAGLPTMRLVVNTDGVIHKHIIPLPSSTRSLVMPPGEPLDFLDLIGKSGHPLTRYMVSSRRF